MGLKLLWTALALTMIDAAFIIPAGSLIAGVLALIGIVLLWLDR